MISKEEVQHIAKLARLQLSEAELEKYQKELSLILDYIAKLKEVDIKGVEPTSHSIEMENITREDMVFPAEAKVKEKLLEQMPEKEGDYLKVKSIL